MFDLEVAIHDWRQQLATAGIIAPKVADELEGHLREVIARAKPAGIITQAEFETAVEHLGNAALLKAEFAKIDGPDTAAGKLKRCLLAFAGVPSHYLAGSGNAGTPLIEARWATYLKAVAFLVPAVFLWLTAATRILPMINEFYERPEIRADSLCLDITRYHFGIIALLKDHLFHISCAGPLLLVLLEWRSAKWPRYRRAVISIGVFVLNSAVLISIFLMIISATVAGRILLNNTR